MSASQRDSVIARINEQTLKLLYLSPERLLSDGFVDFLKKAKLSFIAIDEAHCVSMWGHDFRPEYRQLGSLKQIFPDVTIAAYTATATEQVRNDIAQQLRLKNPQMLIGSFDRPNLVYKVQPRKTILKQVCDVLDRHKGESGIIYCIRRKDVDSMCAQLATKGYSVAPYHAGMTDEDRKKNQEQFINEKVDTIVATIAFGMGIDKSNVRYVIHTGMPKSLEHYQQETGRAGRDGQPADCILFYSGGDFGLWQSIIDNTDAPNADEQKRILGHMYSYCTATACRHRKLVTYFGQDWGRDSCEACDFCLEGAVPLPDSTVIAQKILSCIVRTGQRFGGAHVADVLTGNVTDRVTERGHDRLSTFRLLADQPKPVVMQWLDQLVDQDLLNRDPDYRTLSVTPQGWEVLHSKADARLYEVAQGSRKRKPRRKKTESAPKPTRAAGFSPRGEPTDTTAGNLSDRPHAATAPRPLDTDGQELFERLRALRREMANDLNVPAFVVFSDKSLRDMARTRPTTKDEMLSVWGVGPAKWEAFGQRFLEAVRTDA